MSVTLCNHHTEILFWKQQRRQMTDYVLTLLLKNCVGFFNKQPWFQFLRYKIQVLLFTFYYPYPISKSTMY